MSTNVRDIYAPITVDYAQCFKGLKLCVETQSTAMLWGSYGIGKTSLIYQLADALKMPCCVINPSQDDVIDFKLPYIDENGRWKDSLGESVRLSRFAYSSRLPHDKPGIIFVDEINTASVAMQATLYSLVLEGRIGEYVAPPGTLRFAAGNREHDRCAANTMSAALKDRMSLHMNLVPSVDGWTSYAVKHNFAPEIVSFIRNFGDALDGADPDDPCGGCTPRSLEALSDKVRRGIPKDIEMIVYNGTIGGKFAQQLAGWLELYRANVHVSDILKNPTTVDIPKNMQVIYGIVTALGNIGNAENLGAIAKFLERVEPTYAAVTYSDILKRNDSLKTHKIIRDWQIANYQTIITLVD